LSEQAGTDEFTRKKNFCSRENIMGGINMGRKRWLAIAAVLVLLSLLISGCGKKSELEGKVVDGKMQPLANVRVVAKMSQPIKGYEQFETTTGADGSFKFGKLFPASEYQLILSSERWTKEEKIKTDSGPEGQTKILPEPVLIRFMDSKEGVVLDTKTNLMWAAQDNGGITNWANAKSYCENYRGGGYTDWRMPTQDELAELYASGDHNKDKIKLSGEGVWASETRGSDAAIFNLVSGVRLWFGLSVSVDARALPVRSGK
jgi:hypothetical protein